MTPEHLSALRRSIMDAEGFRSAAYLDSEGFWTIGFGRLIDGRRGGGISRDEGHLLLENDISVALHDCERVFPWFARLSPVRQRVVLEMRFQLGLGGLLEFKATLAAMEAGNDEAVARGLLSAKVAKQTPKRVKRLVQMWTSDTDV